MSAAAAAVAAAPPARARVRGQRGVQGLGRGRGGRVLVGDLCQSRGGL